MENNKIWKIRLSQLIFFFGWKVGEIADCEYFLLEENQFT